MSSLWQLRGEQASAVDTFFVSLQDDLLHRHRRSDKEKKGSLRSPTIITLSCHIEDIF